MPRDATIRHNSTRESAKEMGIAKLRSRSNGWTRLSLRPTTKITPWQLATDHAKETFGDANPTEFVSVLGEVKTEKGLPPIWNSMCLPYGCDGSTRIGEILKASN